MMVFISMGVSNDDLHLFSQLGLLYDQERFNCPCNSRLVPIDCKSGYFLMIIITRPIARDGDSHADLKHIKHDHGLTQASCFLGL